MYYCCKGCNKCCNKCCNCVDDCCKQCCQCWESCCGEICSKLQKCFSAPFSFCTFISFFLTFIPFILAFIAVFRTKFNDCEKPIEIHLLIEGICNFLNFLFCIYLCCKYGANYSPKNDNENRQETNILQRTQNLILYDFIVCFYVILFIFFFVWTIIGCIWLSTLPTESTCDDFVKKIALLNVIVMWIFLIGGSLIFIFTILVYACDEGSCATYETCRCILLCFSCGCCDIGKKQKTIPQKEYRNNYQPERNDWISKSKLFINKLGFFNEKKLGNKHSPTQNQNPASVNSNQMRYPMVPQNNNIGEPPVNININYNQGQNLQMGNYPVYNNNVNNQNYLPNQGFNNGNNTNVQGGSYNYPQQNILFDDKSANIQHDPNKQENDGKGTIMKTFDNFKNKIKKYF